MNASNIAIIVIAIMLGCVVALAGRFIQQGRYRLWKNMVFGSLFIGVLTGIIYVGLWPGVQKAIAVCEAAPLGTTYDCEDDYLVLVFFQQIGIVAGIVNLLLSVLLRVLATPERRWINLLRR